MARGNYNHCSRQHQNRVLPVECLWLRSAGPRGLWLEELWRCHVVGRDIKKAGLLGQVLGTVPLDKEHLKTLFR